MNPLFYFPFHHTTIDASLYNKQDIIDTCINNYTIEKSRNEWNKNCDMHHPYNDCNDQYKEPDYTQLIPLYQSAIQSFFDEVSFSQEVGWNFNVVNYTVTTGNQSMVMHNHLPFVFSAIHYIKFNPLLHRSTLFMNPCSIRSAISHIYNKEQNLLDRNCGYNTFIYPEVSLTTNEDDFIIFPSTVEHMIPPSFSDEERITIALNVSIAEE